MEQLLSSPDPSLDRIQRESSAPTVIALSDLQPCPEGALDAEFADPLIDAVDPSLSSPAYPRSRTTLKFDFADMKSPVVRRTLGILFLLVTVCLWTLCNFLASFIFSDETYNKPFFLIYFNSSFFALSLVPAFVKYLRRSGTEGLRQDVRQLWMRHRHGYTSVEDENRKASQRLLGSTGSDNGTDSASPEIVVEDKLGLGETARLSLEFSILWFLANYSAGASLEYTSVASATILASTSSMWTLIFGSLVRVESFTVRKLVGVMSSFIGVVLISSIDLSGSSDETRGSFPHKTTAQVVLGDSLALFSAVLYGIYIIVMKIRVGNEERVDMQLFFGMVGVFNLTLLWPVFFLLHWTGIEPFEMPPTSLIWLIIVAYSASSIIADMLWAYSMLLTTPLVVTVGMSLNIPLSLVGEMLQYGQYSGFMYWVGAAVVLLSFVFITNESEDAVNSPPKTQPSTMGDDVESAGVV